MKRRVFPPPSHQAGLRAPQRSVMPIPSIGILPASAQARSLDTTRSLTIWPPRSAKTLESQNLSSPVVRKKEDRESVRTEPRGPGSQNQLRRALRVVSRFGIADGSATHRTSSTRFWWVSQRKCSSRSLPYSFSEEPYPVAPEKAFELTLSPAADFQHPDDGAIAIRRVELRNPGWPAHFVAWLEVLQSGFVPGLPRGPRRNALG